MPRLTGTRARCNYRCRAESRLFPEANQEGERFPVLTRRSTRSRRVASMPEASDSSTRRTGEHPSSSSCWVPSSNLRLQIVYEPIVVCPLTSVLHPRWRGRLQIHCAGKDASCRGSDPHHQQAAAEEKARQSVWRGIGPTPMPYHGDVRGIANKPRGVPSACLRDMRE